ncbi:non-hydrolyzing UDP-N-acetylglucosamine 2-epimerase [Patescibacteria group bacterium]
MKKQIHLIAATRPNFIKLSPLIRSLKNKDWCNYTIIHTGQHYDDNMSQIFFDDLEIPKPDVNLNIGSGTHAEQTGKTMIEYEKLLLKDKPNISIVFGDVNATLACALAAKKLHIPVGHVEAGLRSGDMKMPEEINRILTDHISDILWTTSKKAIKTLHEEGVNSQNIHFAGDIMLDNIKNLNDKISNRNTHHKYIEGDDYCVVTLHRPQNVDIKNNLIKIIELFKRISKEITMIFAIHPRTENSLKKHELWDEITSISNLYLTPPQGYIDFMSLIYHSKFIITDSGGIQSETTFLNIPCITLRDSAEKPQTITKGTNVLAESDEVVNHVKSILNNKWKDKKEIEGWDGDTAKRIVTTLNKFLINSNLT